LQPPAACGNSASTTAITSYLYTISISRALWDLVRSRTRLRNRRLQVRVLLGVLFLARPPGCNWRPMAATRVQRRPISSPRREFGQRRSVSGPMATLHCNVPSVQQAATGGEAGKLGEHQGEHRGWERSSRTVGNPLDRLAHHATPILPGTNVRGGLTPEMVNGVPSACPCLRPLLVLVGQVGTGAFACQRVAVS
jgi:hypothetical protein